MKGVARHSIQPQHHSTMLQSSVRIPKAGADCAYLGADGVADHLVQPVPFLRFNVVVQERQNLTARQLRSSIYQATEIEFAFILHNGHVHFLPDALKKPARFFLGRAIVDDNDFERRVECLLANAVDASAE